MSQAPPRTRLTKEARREQLLDTAAEMVLTRGFDALTMEAVAQEAGASKTLGYAYFANVDDLIESLYERELRALYERVEGATGSTDAFDARVEASIRAYFDIVGERGMLIGLLEEGIGTRRTRSGRRLVNSFLGWLAGLIEQEYSIDRQRALRAAAVAARVSDTYARIWAIRHLPRSELEAECVAFVLAGLRAVAAAPR